MKKVALITGCSSGLGMHSAIGLAKTGARVYASMRDLKKSKDLENLAKQENVEIQLLQLDVQDESSVKNAVAQVIQESGKIDILINNAGFGFVRTLEQASFKEVQEVMDVNFFGVARCIRAVLPHMREKRSGHIVTVTSVGGLVGQPLNEIYCAAKFAVEGLIESMAIYMEPYFNIKMTLIEPAGIKTEFVSRVLQDLQSSPLPLQDVYMPIFDTYQQTLAKRGVYEDAGQTAEQVADVLIQSIMMPAPDLRVQSSDYAKAFTKEKIQSDPTGTLLQKRVRKMLLNIE